VTLDKLRSTCPYTCTSRLGGWVRDVNFFCDESLLRKLETITKNFVDCFLMPRGRHQPVITIVYLYATVTVGRVDLQTK
jgi:hypothetical protein